MKQEFKENLEFAKVNASVDFLQENEQHEVISRGYCYESGYEAGAEHGYNCAYSDFQKNMGVVIFGIGLIWMITVSLVAAMLLGKF